jgi:hypothetical protein
MGTYCVFLWRCISRTVAVDRSGTLPHVVKLSVLRTTDFIGVNCYHGNVWFIFSSGHRMLYLNFKRWLRHFHRWSHPMHKNLCVLIGEVSCSTRRWLHAGITSCALYVRNWIAIGWSCRNVNTIWQFVLTEFDHMSFPLHKSLCLNQVIASTSTGPYYALQWTRLMVLQFCSNIVHCSEQGWWCRSSVQILCTAVNKADGAAVLFRYCSLQWTKADGAPVLFRYCALQWTRLVVLQFCSDIVHCSEQGW